MSIADTTTLSPAQPKGKAKPARAKPPTSKPADGKPAKGKSSTGTAASPKPPKASAPKKAAAKKGSAKKGSAKKAPATAAGTKLADTATNVIAPTAATTVTLDRRAAATIAQSVKSISDGNRIQIMAILSGGPTNVGDICEVIGQSQPAVSHHLSLMRFGGVVEAERKGKNSFYNLTEKGRALARIIEQLA